MSMRRQNRFLEMAAMMATLIVLCAACDENPKENDLNDPANFRVVKVSGDDQSERVGATLANSLTVRVRDILNNPKQGVTITFRAAESGASVSSSTTTSDTDGTASCELTLGTTAGTYHAIAAIESDSVTFSAEAVELGCSEETPAPTLVWPAGHIFISTTSSSLISGSGSVIIDYNPETEEITKVLETTETLTDIAFSPRGELFCSASDAIFKVNASPPHALANYVAYTGDYAMEIDPNEGSVLAGVGLHGPVTIPCPSSGFTILYPDVFADIRTENLVADPTTRNLFIVNELAAGQFILWRIFWDGRSDPTAYEPYSGLTVGTTAVPRGMCMDTTGTIYVTFDGNDSWRRIVSVSPGGDVNTSFFNFYTHAGGNSIEAGRWGDITHLKGNLYLIDRRNDRLVVISRDGEWVKAVSSTAFSAEFLEGERYGISASPF